MKLELEHEGVHVSRSSVFWGTVYQSFETFKRIFLRRRVRLQFACETRASRGIKQFVEQAKVSLRIHQFSWFYSEFASSFCYRGHIEIKASIGNFNLAKLPSCQRFIIWNSSCPVFPFTVSSSLIRLCHHQISSSNSPSSSSYVVFSVSATTS